MVEPTSNSTTKGAKPPEWVTPTRVADPPPPRIGKRAVFFSRIKRRILKHIWLTRLGLLAGVIALGYLLFLVGGFFFRQVGVTNYPVLAYDFIFTPAEKIKSAGGRVNIVIMGKSGTGHAGADLTDTMMFASISLTKPSVSIISIPRDIWIPEIRAKINSAYYWGNQKQPGGGLILAKSEVEEVIGQPVQYGIVMDFNGFQKIIDAIGGIDVYVERSFVDSEYPIAGRENDTCGGDPQFRCRYETVKFDKGWQHMDGETALKFVRSRHAEGDEGTDIAREARQEKVVAAVKDKLLNPKALLDIKKDIAVWNIVKGSVETDINADAATILARSIIEGRGKVSSQVIPEDLLVNPPVSARYDNLYVFIPKAGNWNDVHDWVQKLLESK